MQNLADIERGVRIVVLLSGVFWLIWQSLYLLGRLYWWQVKEYRFDRMRAHEEGQRQSWLWGIISPDLRVAVLQIFLLLYGILWLAYLMGQRWFNLYYPYYFILTILAVIVLVGYFGYQSWRAIEQASRSGLFRPRWTIKTLILGCSGVLLLLYGILPLLYFYPGTLLLNPELPLVLRLWLAGPYLPVVILIPVLMLPLQVVYVLGLAILSLLVDPLIRLLIWLLSPLTQLGLQRRIRAAQEKISALPALKVVGITGSYGKSTTKEMLATLLGKKQKIAKTPANNNTAIGLANAILADLQEDTTIFIGEYGAYTEGEIKAMTEVAPPDIAIITAINAQHLSLFGSIEQTMDAKYELIEGLKEGGVAIFNADDRRVMEMAKRFDGRKYFYSVKGRLQVGGERPPLLAMNIRETADGIGFDLLDNRKNLDDDKKTAIQLNLLGRHQVGNFLAAATTALVVGMPIAEIAQAAEAIAPKPGGLRKLAGRDQTVILDDSYSSNPSGFLAALEVLKNQDAKRRIVITRGMQELGEEAVKAHREVAVALSSKVDLLILLEKTHEDALRQGIGQDKKAKTRVMVEPEAGKVVDYLSGFLQKGDVVLLEGRLPDKIFRSMLEGKELENCGCD